MTFRGTSSEAKKPEKRKPNDIFCRWELPGSIAFA